MNEQDLTVSVNTATTNIPPASTIEPVSDESVLSQLDLRNFRIFFHATVLIIFALLIFSPVYSTIQKGAVGLLVEEGVQKTVTGLQKVPVIDYGPFDGVFILLLGWLGLFGFSVSWFWFIGYIYLSLKIKDGLTSLGLVAVNVLFVLCLVGLSIVGIGQIEPGDIDCSCREIVGHLSGYYMYIVLIAYLIAVSVILFTKVPSVVRVRLIKLLSLLALIGVFISTYFFNPYVNKKLIDNTAGTAYLEQQEIEWKNRKAYNEDYYNYFQSTDESNVFRLHGCNQGEVSNICGKEREIFYVSYPGTLSGSGQDILVIKQYIESNFKKHAEKIVSLREKHFGEIHDDSLKFAFKVNTNPYQREESTVLCTYTNSTLRCD